MPIRIKEKENKLLVRCEDSLYNASPSVDPLDGEGMKIECPKCGSQSAVLIREGKDIIIKCLCGLDKLVASEHEAITIAHNEIEEDIQLPRKGTKLAKCLGAAYTLSPATTAEITEELNNRGNNWSSDEVASFLTVLRYKGLVDVVTYRKGVAGGSTWEITDITDDLMCKKLSKGV